jgi:hypothetical protein
MQLSIEKNAVIRVRPSSGPYKGRVVALVDGAGQIGPDHSCQLVSPWGVTIADGVAVNGDLARALGLYPTTLRAASRRELSGV